MQDNERMLDQLWFTWSTSGLGSMPMGYRVRAASDGFSDTQGQRYRRVSRFLSYEKPEGVSINEFTPAIAPISFSFVYNGEEREPLLIRKIFTGADGVGRNGNFFAHLIAGLPPEFTARDAIRLWYCPNLWVESEAGKPPYDTHLDRIPYGDIRAFVDHSQTSFNFAQISEQLQSLLLLIQTRGLPQRIQMRGHPTMIASLIYGLTHTLPMQKLLQGLTFTTYESNAQESEVIITGTVNGTELQDISRLQVLTEQTAGAASPKLQGYVSDEVNELLKGSAERLIIVMDEFDRNDQTAVDDLVELFNKRFQIGPLTLTQWEDTVRHPSDNLDDLCNSAFQEKAILLLLSQPDYWQSRGREVLKKVKEWLLSVAQSRSKQQAREAMILYMNGTIEYLYPVIRTELLQGTLPLHSTTLLGDFAYPSTHPAIYLRMLTEFAQEPMYSRVRTDALWNFHLWLLSCAKLMQPPPTWEQIFPWLHIPAWDKLKQVLKLDLLVDWEHQTIFELLSPHRDIPKEAYLLVKAQEAKFIRSMQSLLIQGSQTNNQEWINTALRLFEAIIHYDEQASKNNEPEYRYPDRASLLLALLSAVPNDSQVIDWLFTIVPFASPYQLTMEEYDRVVAGCRPEVLAAGGKSPALMKYLVEYVLSLSPKKLNANTISLLEQFQRAAATLPPSTANLVNSWLDINAFLTSKQFDDKKLRNIEPALASLVPLLEQRGQNIWQEFVEELAPYLITLVETEYQLQIVLNVFEGAGVVGAWSLLYAMAVRAGAAYIENKNLYLLFPYVIVGIREHTRARYQKNVLDMYFKSLFAQVSDNALGDLDKSLFTRAWPESTQAEWKGWRERSKPSIGAKIRSGLPFQGPRAQAEPQIEKVESKPQFQPAIPAIVSPERPAVSLPNQAPSIWRPPADQPTAVADRVIFYVTVGKQIYSFKGSQYQLSHKLLARILPYWQTILRANRSEDRADSITFEEKTISGILNDLERISSTTISKNITQFLVDGLLIDIEIKQLCASGDRNVIYSLDSENFIAPVLNNFQESLGDPGFQAFIMSYGEKAIRDVFSKLIRRNQLILLMIKDKENFKGGWKKWLEQERKQARLAYIKND